MANKCISIVMPVYNKEKYVADILKDLSRQSFGDFECIVIDDGSNDNTGKICDAFAWEDSRFKVYHISNGGVSHARNVGLDIANGDYITFIDGDDTVPHDYLQVLYDCVTNSNAEMAICSAFKTWKNGRSEQICLPGHGLCKMTDLLVDFAKNQKETGIYGYCWGKILKKDLVANIRFDESVALAEDFDFYIKIYPLVKQIYFTDSTAYFYFQDAQNSSALIDDYEIDYRKQLTINLRYRDFLNDMGVYNDENQKIVSQKLSNYVFFSIFYCKISEFDDSFADLHKICVDKKIVCKGINKIQKWFLWLLCHNCVKIAKVSLKVYRIIKKLLRGEQ